MNEALTIKQAARFVGKDEKTVRRWIVGKHPRLPRETDSKGRYLIARNELERILQEDTEDIAPAFDEALLRDIQHRLLALEQRFDRLEAMLQTAPSPRPPRAAPIAYETPAGSTLPKGWVLISDLIKAHGLGSQRKAIIAEMERTGYLKKGDWKVNGHHANNALDSEGQAEFIRLFARLD